MHSDLQSENCPPTAAACRKTPSGIIDSLGQISTQKLRMDGMLTVIVKPSLFMVHHLHQPSFCGNTTNLEVKTFQKICYLITFGGEMVSPVSQTACLDQ